MIVRPLLAASLVAAVAVAVGVGGASAATGPRLVLSVHSGKPGTRVRVTGLDCPHPGGEADTMIFHRVSAPAADIRRIRPLHRHGNTVTAVFVVERGDGPGLGFLDLNCGGTHGNAVATFTVRS